MFLPVLLDNVLIYTQAAFAHWSITIYAESLQLCNIVEHYVALIYYFVYISNSKSA